MGMRGLIVMAALGVLTAAPAMAQDAAKGAARFKLSCGPCHSTEPGKNGSGPSLAGIVGRKAASVDGFVYSTALKGAGLTWTEASLDHFLEAPAKAVPGTTMAFPGLRKAEDRADLIAFLKHPVPAK